MHLMFIADLFIYQKAKYVLIHASYGVVWKLINDSEIQIILKTQKVIQ